MKNWFSIPLLACLATATFFSASAQDDKALIKKAHKIHEKAFTIDTHADTPMLLSRGSFDVTKDNDPRTTNSKVDYPRMKRGGLDAIFWAVYLGQGPRTPEGHETAKKKAMGIFYAIDVTLKKTASEAALATTPEEAYQISKTGKRVILLVLKTVIQWATTSLYSSSFTTKVPVI